MTASAFLIGFMGVGKSAVGRVVAGRLGLRFVDLDDAVERAAGRSIDRIFREEGEGKFRAMEEAALLRCVEELAERPAIVACGGGMLLGVRQRRAMRAAATVVWLDASLATVSRRIANASRRVTRPLWDDDPIENAARFERRRATYALADVRVDADGPVERVADVVVEGLATFRRSR